MEFQGILIVLTGLAMLVGSLLFSVIGVVRMKFWLLILGAVLLLPFAYYMNGYPNLRGFAILLPFFQMGSAAAVRENNRTWAWILLAPPFLAVLWIIGVAVLNAV
jgi:hypothetical protein